MAAGIILFDPQTEPMRKVVRGLNLVQEGKQVLIGALAIIEQYRDGDGSQAIHYDLLANAGTFASGDYADANTAAKASYDEVSSVLFKLNTNSSVTDVSAAITQACAKHGV
jgi:hypothetical protein